MPNRRSNKSAFIGSIYTNQPWFVNSVKRNKKRNKVAKESRRRNRDK